LRTVLNIIFRTAPALALFGLLAGRPAPVRAEPSEVVYATPKTVLASFFPKSERVTYRTLLEERSLKRGEKIVLGSAAAGYSMVMATGEWTGSAGKTAG